MKSAIEAVEQYIQDNLHLKVKIYKWKEQATLPFFLIDNYDFYEFSLLGQSCLLMVNKIGADLTPETIKKHREQLHKKCPSLSIYVQTVISAYNRKRLIKHQVPFIIPGNQMYLPDLGIDLREHFRAMKINKRFFSPATQALIIYALHHGTNQRYIPSELAKKLGYSHMTMTRAFDELETMEIGEINRKGRERWWIFKEGRRELWKQTESFMRNPIKNRTWLKRKKPRIIAGLSALAHFSMLNPPKMPIYAISMDEWKDWKESGVVELPIPEDAAFELEIWRYNPNLFAEEGIVDPFSLYLCLRENDDERVEAALEEMLEKIEW